MKLAMYSLRGPSSFRNQADLIARVAVQEGYECFNKDMADRVKFPKDHFDRTIVLCPIWPRYVMDSARLSAPWISRSFTLYGPVDGPLTQNLNLMQILTNMGVVVPSQFCYDSLVKSGVTPKGIVKHGVDPEDFIFEDVPKYSRYQQLKAKYPGRQIMFTNINPLHRKGLKHLAAALNILSAKRPDTWIFILHTGREKALQIAPDLEQVKDLVIEDAYGQLPFREMALKTKSCDLFVWPSMLEGFGLPLLEAAAAERAIVCLDAPAMNEIVDSSMAWLFPSTGIKVEKWDAPSCLAQLHEYDPAALAEAIMQALDHPKESVEKAARAFKRSKKYNYQDVYKPLVRGAV